MSKLKAFVRYDGTNRIVPGGPILQRSKPKNGVWEEIGVNDCCDDFITADNKKLRAFVRIDGKHNVVAGSLILLEKKPNVGRWVQIPTSNCCNIICNCYEAATPNGINITSIAYRDCSGVIHSVAPGDSVVTCINEIITYGDGNAIALGSSCKLDASCSNLTICYQMYDLFTCTVTYIDSNGITQTASNNETVCAKINSVQIVGPCLVPGGALWSKVYDVVNNSYLPCVDCGCQPLRLVWVALGDVPVADPYDVTEWNTFFDLPTNGTPFSAVDVIGDAVYLYGGGNMTIRNSLFVGLSLVSISDGKVDGEGVVLCPGVVTSIGPDAFEECHTLETVSLPSVLTTSSSSFNTADSLSTVFLPSLTIVGFACFAYCTSLINIDLPSVITVEQGAFSGVGPPSGFGFGGTVNLPLATSIGNIAFAGPITSGNFTLNIPSCTALGTTVGNNSVFINITLCTINLTVPVALMTCNSGSPDGDIQYLVANNTVTITTV